MKNSKYRILLFIVIPSLIYIAKSDFFMESLYRSAINDRQSILSRVWDDNGISIQALRLDESEETNYKKNNDRQYLKNNRKLKDEELKCLETGVFSALLVDGYLDIICYNDDGFIYIE